VVQKSAAVAFAAVGVGVTFAIGFSVAAIASSGSPSGAAAPATTSETHPTSTTELGKSIPYAAPLRASAEVPKPNGVAAGAGGVFTLTLTDKAGKYTAKWKLTFHNLTGKATAAHIHKGKPGKAGPVVVPLCGPCRSGQTGTAKIPEAVVTAIEKGGAYANVHTATNAAGEIRGQLAKK
jgi:hypothetical protein